MKFNSESYQSGPLPEKKGESIKNTIGKVGFGVVATAVASLAMPNDVVAQKGLVGRFMDKIHPKTEQVSGDKAENNQAEKNDSIIYNSESDKEGFKYPFSKVYESDKDFYRTVAYAHSFTLDGANEDAYFEALTKLKNENNLSKISSVSIIEETSFKNKETGIITVVIAIKMPRSEESKKSQGQETKFIGGVKDKDGVEYPFSKVYESDKDFYRVMAVGTGYDDRSMTENVAEGVAYDKIRAIIAEELKMNGELLHLEMHPKTIVSRYDKNTKTGIYTNYIAVEVPRSNVKIEKIKSESKTLDIPWEGDKIGFKYPFKKEYKSDDKFYRVVAYSSDYTIEKAKRKATMVALNKKNNEQQKTIGWNLVDGVYQEDAKTGLITFVVVFEATRVNNVEKEISSEVDKKHKPQKHQSLLQ